MPDYIRLIMENRYAAVSIMDEDKFVARYDAYNKLLTSLAMRTGIDLGNINQHWTIMSRFYSEKLTV